MKMCLRRLLVDFSRFLLSMDSLRIQFNRLMTLIVSRWAIESLLRISFHRLLQQKLRERVSYFISAAINLWRNYVFL